MRNNNKLITILILLGTLQNICFAKDTCFTSWESDKENAEIIFVGKLYEVHNHVFWDGNMQVSVYNFVLSESYKGLTESDNFISVIAPINGCCTIKYKLDSTYVMFANRGVSTADIYWTNDCYSNAINPNISEVRKYFGTPILHKPELIQLTKYRNKRNIWVDSVRAVSGDLILSNAALKSSNSNLKWTIAVLSGVITLLFVILFQSRKAM